MPHGDARVGRPVPFFEFMLYEAKSFEPAKGDARFACVARGRSLTLVPIPPGRRRLAGRAVATNAESGAGIEVVSR